MCYFETLTGSGMSASETLVGRALAKGAGGTAFRRRNRRLNFDEREIKSAGLAAPPASLSARTGRIFFEKLLFARRADRPPDINGAVMANKRTSSA